MIFRTSWCIEKKKKEYDDIVNNIYYEYGGTFWKTFTKVSLWFHWIVFTFFERQYKILKMTFNIRYSSINFFSLSNIVSFSKGKYVYRKISLRYIIFNKMNKIIVQRENS